MKAKEVRVIEKIQEKLNKKFPNLIELARDEFLEFAGEEIREHPRISQLFYGWFFGSFCLYDGKTIPILCKESLTLTEEEKTFLDNIKNAICGFFEVVKVGGNKVLIKDLMTNKEYSVHFIDLDYDFKEKDIIEANLVKNFENNYFFFGGFILRNGKEGIRLRLLEYTRDLTIDELSRRELMVIQKMKEQMKDDSVLQDYLKNVLGIREDEVKDFLALTENQQKEFLKEKIKEIEENYAEN